MKVEIRRIASGPSLLVEDAEQLVLDFLVTDPSAAPGGYDDFAGRGEPGRVTADDIIAINRTMRARSPHAAWEPLTSAEEPLPWLAALDPSWDLVALDDDTWLRLAKPAMAAALVAAKGRGRSVATKVLHLKRPAMFPVLDSLVLQNLGATQATPAIMVVDHLRAEGRRNLEELRGVQAAERPRYERSLVRILDILLWASHPAAGLGPRMTRWQHVVRLSNRLG